MKIVFTLAEVRREAVKRAARARGGGRSAQADKLADQPPGLPASLGAILRELTPIATMDRARSGDVISSSPRDETSVRVAAEQQRLPEAARKER